eukprot:7504958-Pyramimonas_sp.AAC.1
MQCWSPPGPLLERSCAGPSCWAPLGDPLGHIGAVLMPQRLIGREKSRGQKLIDLPWAFARLWLLKCPLGQFEGHLEPSWGCL